MLVASTGKLQYGGSNYESEMSKITSSLLKVGVYNKRTHKFKLYDTDFFHLKPLLKCRIDFNNSQKSWSEKTEDLALTFGSKNRKRVITSRLKYESASNDTISYEKIQSNISLETTVIEERKDDCLIPPQNKDAKCVDDIYSIYDVVPKEDYDCLDTEARIFTNITRENLQLWRNEAKYCDLILHFLETRYQSLSLHTAKLLCYLNYMTILIKTTYKDLKRKDPFPDIPQPYKSSLMEKFLVNRSLPLRMKDKILSHAMILALTINNYHIDGKMLASSTHASMTRIVLVAYSLGCHVKDKKAEGTKLIELKLPLFKYEPRGRQKK
ncbi:DNA-directed RNA polymerase I subunit RPA49-like isoform X2 [Argiope bruennichi]|nr:DNA-directed RNA polymerase I subunit RPA49-like isoform X2 [Argiope bruennichi]